MGSWNATCNLSNLPITPGTPVRVLFLGRCPCSIDPPNPLRLDEDNSHSREGVYATDFWYPRTIPLRAVYDDCGEVREVAAGPGLELFWAQLRRDCVPVPEGENRCHEPASSLEMNWRQMWWVATEGRLRVRSDVSSWDLDGDATYEYPVSSLGALPVCAVLVREDEWRQTLRTTVPFRNDREVVRDGQIVGYETYEVTVETYDERLRAHLAATQADVERAPERADTRILLNMHGTTHTPFLRQVAPPFALGVEFCWLHLVRRVVDGTWSLASPAVAGCLRDLAEISFVATLYGALRRTWHPGTGRGSQAEHYEACGQFHERMARLAYRVFARDQADQACEAPKLRPRRARRVGRAKARGV